MSPTIFGTLDGQPVYEVALRSTSGAEAKVISWGAVVRDLQVPRPGGGLQRVVLGLNSLDDYRQHSPHFGAVAGRFANRIAGGRFSLDGTAYQLPLNQDGKHSLHGGGQGFGKRPWQLAALTDDSVTLTLVSPDGDHGYPGDLTVTCTYRLVGTALRVELSATTTKATPVNLCHHSYFNLDGSADILDHELEIAADHWTPVDADLIPTGEIRAVAGTPLDFRASRPIRHQGADGARTWYDHNWVLRRDRSEPSGLAHRPLAFAARLASRRSGVALDVWTTEPALQFYDGFKVNLPVPGLDGAAYGPNAGLCLEPQHFPDSPNRPYFPDTILRLDEVYRQITEYRFGPA